MAILSSGTCLASGTCLGRATRRRVEARFSWASVGERTEQIYAEAIADFKRRTPHA